MIFIDLEKAYDKVLLKFTNGRWRRKKINYLRSNDKHEGVVISMRTVQYKGFFYNSGLHQGSTLNTFLFILVMNKLINIIQKEVL